MMSDGLRPDLARATAAAPEASARRMRSAWVAGAEPAPGRHMPRVSVMQPTVLAGPITIDRISQNEYLFMPNKLTTGRPAQYFVQRTTTPVLFVYPAADTAQTYTFRYYAIRRIEDVGVYTNTADVVFRFLPCLVAGLSYYLALKKAPERIQLLKTIYEEEFARAAIEDRDIASVYLTPDFGQ